MILWVFHGTSGGFSGAVESFASKVSFLALLRWRSGSVHPAWLFSFNLLIVEAIHFQLKKKKTQLFRSLFYLKLFRSERLPSLSGTSMGKAVDYEVAVAQELISKLLTTNKNPFFNGFFLKKKHPFS